MDLQHADDPFSRDERDPHARARGDAPRDVLVYLRVVDDRVDPFAAPPVEHATALRVGARHRHADEVAGPFARRRGDAQLVLPCRERDGDETGPQEFAQVVDDEAEQRFDVSLGRERVADLVQRLQLPRPAGRRLVEPRVLDGDSRLTRKQGDELLILLGEVLPKLLLGEIEVAVGDAAQQDRHAQERLHRRMRGREADRPRILGQVMQAERLRIVDERSEDPAPVRKGADRCVSLRVDAVRQKPLELRTGLVDDAQRGVPCARQLRRDFDESLQNGVERELGGDCDARLEQRTEPALAGRSCIHWTSVVTPDAGQPPAARRARGVSPRRRRTRCAGCLRRGSR